MFSGLSKQYPLVIAANRDEVPARQEKTAAPNFLTDDIFAPRDLVHGGTWIGVNRHGVVAALTNRSLQPRSHGRRSRGLLVTEALACQTAPQAVAATLAAPSGTYNGFHLFIADDRMAMLLWSDGQDIKSRPVPMGLHVFTGIGCEPGHGVRDRMIRERAIYFRSLGDRDWLDDILSFHGPESEDGTCVHGPDVRMESGFSMLIHRPEHGRFWNLNWRQGRPCLGGDWSTRLVAITDDQR